jgi:hypothetical protein
MKRDPEQAPLGRAVHRQIEHRRRHSSVDDALDLAGGLLQHEHVVVAEERDADRLVEARDGRPDGQIRVDQRRCRVGAAG